MRISISKEWCMRRAELEGNSAVGAGMMASPTMESEYIVALVDLDDGRWENATAPFVSASEAIEYAKSEHPWKHKTNCKVVVYTNIFEEYVCEQQ